MVQRRPPPVQLVAPDGDADAPEAPGPPKYIERMILPFFDQSLWAVLFAIVVHLATFLALLFLQLFGAKSIPSAAGLALLMVLSTIPIRDEWAWRGRLGSVTALVVCTWLFGAGLAWVANAYGIW